MRLFGSNCLGKTARKSTWALSECPQNWPSLAPGGPIASCQQRIVILSTCSVACNLLYFLVSRQVAKVSVTATAPGVRLPFPSRRLRISSYSNEPSFKEQPHDSPIEQVAARLAAFPKPDEVFVSGSCFRIAKNLYVTARHVMTDYLDQFGHNKGEVDCECWAIHILPGPEYGIWQVDYFWLSPHSDLAVFHTNQWC